MQKTSLTCGTGKAADEHSAHPREGCQHTAWLCGGIKEGVGSQSIHGQGLRVSEPLAGLTEGVSLQKQSGERAGDRRLSAQTAAQDYEKHEQSRRWDTTGGAR